MKKYIIPDIEFIKYETDEVLGDSVVNLQKNGQYNAEFEYQEQNWDDNII